VKITISTIIVVLLTTLMPDAKVTTADAGREMLAATCFCKISKDDLRGQRTASGVVMDLTGDVNKTYTGVYQQHEDNQVDCKKLCKTAAEAYTKQNIANASCAAGVSDNSWINAFSAVGTKVYREALEIGQLANKPQVTSTTCTCPPSWLANPTNVPGGVTSDGKCKKLAAKPINITPLPPNGTPVGSWGFTWGDEVWAMGSSANGGAAACVTSVVTPPHCFIY
jgi:hypothetical protein